MTNWTKRVYRDNKKRLENTEQQWVDDGGKALQVSIDPASGAQIFIDQAQSQIHEGVAYETTAQATGGSGIKATLTFTTSDTKNWMHLLVHARSNVEAHFTLGEGPTIGAATGTNKVVYNRNRNSTNTSGIFGTRTVTVGNVTEGATVTSFGTPIEIGHFGGGRTGGESRGQDEWILKQNTTYALEVESEAASADIEIYMSWYEIEPTN